MQPKPFSFRLWTVFYVFAVVAAALATFGPGGVFPAAIVLGFWAWIYHAKKPLTLVEWLVLIINVLVVIALLLPAVSSSREASRRGWCMNNLKQLAVALLHYETRSGSLPPAYIADADGTPLLSWRALILPSVERGDLHESLDLSKSWDDPSNQIGTSMDVELFRCPNDWSPRPWNARTSYFAVVGPGTAWPGGRSRKMSEITDPKSHTILLIEAAGRNTQWAQPADLTFDEAVELLSDPSPDEVRHYFPPPGFFYKEFGKTGSAIHVAMADGQVRLLALPLPKELAVALLTVDGGEGGIHELLDRYSGHQLDYAKCYGFGVLVFLSLLPAAWVRWRGAKRGGSVPGREGDVDEERFGVAADANTGANGRDG